MSEDYYDVLGIKPNSSKDEIKKAYRKLAMEYHPDKNQDDKKSEEKFKAVAEAYSTLADDNNRANYDIQRNFKRSGGNKFRGKADQSNFGNFTFDDFVNDAFGSNRFGGAKRRTRTRHTFSNESFSFDTSHLNINVHTEKDILGLLNGDNILIEYQRTVLNGKRENKKIQLKLNLRSRYSKIFEENDTHYIKVSLDGMGNENAIQKMNIWGEREQLITMGNLIIKINIISDKKFKIEDGNIIQDIEIDLHTALFNDEKSFIVDSILGKKYKIDIRKPKSLSSLKFTINGLGILKHDNTIGNYIASFTVKSPDINKLSDKDKESIEKILSNKDLY